MMKSFRITRRAFLCHSGAALAVGAASAVGAVGAPLRAEDQLSYLLGTGTTGAGRSVLRLFYVGHGEKSAALGFAAAFDSSGWRRFPYNPVLTGPGRPSEPSNLSLGDSYLLYFGDAGRIAVTTNEAGNPTEGF